MRNSTELLYTKESAVAHIQSVFNHSVRFNLSHCVQGISYYYSPVDDEYLFVYYGIKVAAFDRNGKFNRFL